MKGLEAVYAQHHKRRGEDFAILTKERGSFLRKHIEKGKKVLDLGCRDGRLTSEYADDNEVFGVDVDADALRRAEENYGIKTMHVDLNGEWPIEENAFDAVVACEFLEHIYFPEVVFEKIKKVLKEEGIFVGTIPHAYSLQSRIKFLFGTKRGTPLEDPTHINHFSYPMFKNILENHFEVIEIVGLAPKKYTILAKVFPFLFAHDLMFAVRIR